MATKSDLKYGATALIVSCLRTVLLLFILQAPAFGAEVNGRIVSALTNEGSSPVSGVRVCGFLSFADQKAVNCSLPSNDDGEYQLTLPAGKYQLSGFNQEGNLFAFSGKTSVEIMEAQPLWLGLQAVPAAPIQISDYDDDTSGGVGGKIYFAGRPLQGAYLYLYHADDELLRGQAYRISLPTAQDGSFQLDDLPSGRYLLIARKRQSGSKVGPVIAGDQVAFLPDWLIEVAEGKQIELHIHAITKAEDQIETARSDQPVLQGKVVDEDGQPVAGVHIFAYRDRVIGHQQPTALSPETTNDGTFRIILPGAGIFYIGAREYYGDSPEPGELFGLFEGTVDHGMKVTPGEKLNNVTISVEPVKIQ